MSRVLASPGQPLVSTPAISTKRRVGFLLLQMFALIYLQKFAIGAGSSQISIPMVIMVGSMVWMLLSGDLVFVPLRLATYLLFIGFCLLSQILNGAAGSMLSMPYLIVLYSFMTVRLEMSEDDYRYVADKFVKFMIFPAIIIIVQYTFQKATGLPDPINMDNLVPKHFLLQGYIYAGHYPWNSPFSRPNGFFFLEPSFASAFAAVAVVIELTCFKRFFLASFMLLATVLTLGATGMTLLAVAAPFILARQKAGVAMFAVATLVAALVILYVMGVPLPLLSRVNELGSTNTSGAARLLLPATEFVSLIGDPAFLFAGAGAGSVTQATGFGPVLEVSPWPVLKLIREYGFFAMVSFLVFYLSGIARSANVTLAVALSFIYHFTGGYLLNPIMVELLVLTCFIVGPVRPAEKRLQIRPGTAPHRPVRAFPQIGT